MSEEATRRVRCRTRDNSSVECNSADLVFRPSVYGVAIQEGNVLLIPQWDGYDFPGGGIDKGERIEEALVREVKEETGMDVKPGALLLTTDDFFMPSEAGKAPFHSILMFYACEIAGGALSTDGFTEFEKEIARLAEWVPIEKAMTLKFYNPIDNAALIRKAAAL